jgi:hypothetical protein
MIETFIKKPFTQKAPGFRVRNQCSQRIRYIGINNNHSWQFYIESSVSFHSTELKHWCCFPINPFNFVQNSLKIRGVRDVDSSQGRRDRLRSQCKPESECESSIAQNKPTTAFRLFAFANAIAPHVQADFAIVECAHPSGVPSVATHSWDGRISLRGFFPEPPGPDRARVQPIAGIIDRNAIRIQVS